MVEQTTTDALRRMQGKEGLVLQGCGRPLEEWVDGINKMLTEEEILKNGTTFQKVLAFEHDGCTNLLYPFDGVEIAVGKLAMWRLQTHGRFGGTWLSDYVENRLGGFEAQKQEPGAGQKSEQEQGQKPDCPLIGADGNIFNLMGIASRTLRRAGMQEQAEEMQKRITGGDCHSYYEALAVIGEYVNITDQDGDSMNQRDGMDMR